MKDFQFPDNELDISVGDCLLTETHMSGSYTVTEEDGKNHPEYICDGFG